MAESILKIPKLLGSSNWDLWSIRMEAILIEKGYYDVMAISLDTIDLSTYTPEQINSIRDKSNKACAYIRLAIKASPQYFRAKLELINKALTLLNKVLFILSALPFC